MRSKAIRFIRADWQAIAKATYFGSLPGFRGKL